MAPLDQLKLIKMLEVAANFYKTLFAKEDRVDITLGDHFWDPDDLVTDEENEKLQRPFSMDEIKEAVFGSYAAKGTRVSGDAVK